MSNGNIALKEARFCPDADSTLVGRHRAAGLVIAGRTNSPEVGSVPTTEPVAWGPTRNPWDTSRTPGGSSGGAAAAVASGMVPFAHASDGGGSIRIPASCCGLVGLKPSQGRITLGPARDESGLSVQHCVSRTVRDSAALLDATLGPGVGDTVIAPASAGPYVEEIGMDPGRLRIGLLDHHPQGASVDAECTTAAQNVATLLESLGHIVEPSWPKALEDRGFGATFGALWAANMGMHRRRFAEQIARPLTDDELEPMNRAQADMASHFSAVDYVFALSAAAQYRRAIQSWWYEGWDLLLTPTLAELPLTLGTLVNDPENPMAIMQRAGLFVPFTPPFNTSGQPAISLPLEWTDGGLPVGVQLVAAYGREDVLIRVASQLEQAKPWAGRVPEV
jgi:amidase